MDFDEINSELQLLAAEQAEEAVAIQYDQMMEEMYGSDPRWFGPDRDDYTEWDMVEAWALEE